MTAVSNQTLVTWNSAANTAPVVHAVTNQTITLPTNSATLNGTATDDGLPNGTLTTTWTQVSGPVQAAIASPNQLVTVVSFTQPGSYVFKLTASDSVLTSSANVTITVNQQNLAPFITISVDSTVITQPANTVHVTGTATDDGFPTGSTLTTQWTQVSGPAAATVSNPNSPNTSITFPAAGTYVLKLSASRLAAHFFGQCHHHSQSACAEPGSHSGHHREPDAAYLAQQRRYPGGQDLR